MEARAYIEWETPCRLPPPPHGRQAPVTRGEATAPVARWGGRHAPLLFFFGHGPRCKFEEKKLHLVPVAPRRSTGGSFEIFQNGHIFLKF